MRARRQILKAKPIYRPIHLGNFEAIPQIRRLPPRLRRAMRVVGSVLPFKSNGYVVDKLIDWKRAPEDPVFISTFPQKDMLRPDDYSRVDRLLSGRAEPGELRKAVDEIRRGLNPHPAGQMEHNRPTLAGEPLAGVQHKYSKTVLFFPSRSQTCHAYCTFCFRWAQFVGIKGLKFAASEVGRLVRYLRTHPNVSDVLFTGGDPLVMKARFLRGYIEPLLKIPSVRTVRIGSKALSYWPHRFTADDDAQELLALFRAVSQSGRHLAYMAHFNHPAELGTPEVEEAIAALRATGAQIRTQSPVLRRINDASEVWARMWRRQVDLGCVPYYMFIARDTGAQAYFEVPLERAWRIFQRAYKRVSGVCRTVRGPSMSATPGKVQVLGVAEAAGNKVFVLRFLQGRNPDWVARPFFAEHDPKATWFDQLRPAFGKKKFFFDDELARILARDRLRRGGLECFDDLGGGAP